VFVHLLLGEQEVVLRSRAYHVSAAPGFVAAAEAILGPGAVILDHAGPA
jgi:chemotaxis protein histidine kinase CheA